MLVTQREHRNVDTHLGIEFSRSVKIVVIGAETCFLESDSLLRSEHTQSSADYYSVNCAVLFHFR